MITLVNEIDADAPFVSDDQPFFDKTDTEFFITDNFDVDARWKATDADVATLNAAFNALGGENEIEPDELAEHIRIDTKTQRIIHKGFILFDGESYFANEMDAVTAYNAKMGTDYTDFETIYQKHGGDSDKNDCYFTTWTDF